MIWPDPALPARVVRDTHWTSDDGALHPVQAGTSCAARPDGYVELDRLARSRGTVPPDSLQILAPPYEPIATPLFVRPPHWRQVRQDAGRDCALAAVVQALLVSQPRWPTEAVRDGADGTVQVRLFEPTSQGVFVAQWYSVAKSLSRTRRAHRGDLWWLLLEKAVAARGWEENTVWNAPGNPAPHRRESMGGYCHVYMEMLTGKPAVMHTLGAADTCLETIKSQLKEGKAVCLSTARVLPQDSTASTWWDSALRLTSLQYGRALREHRGRGGMLAEHCYAVVGVRSTDGSVQIKLHDPAQVSGTRRIALGPWSAQLATTRGTGWIDWNSLQHCIAALYCSA